MSSPRGYKNLMQRRAQARCPSRPLRIAHRPAPTLSSPHLLAVPHQAYVQQSSRKRDALLPMINLMRDINRKYRRMLRHMEMDDWISSAPTTTDTSYTIGPTANVTSVTWVVRVKVNADLGLTGETPPSHPQNHL